MLALNERRLVPAHRPVKLARGVPSLFRRHPAQHRDLFRTRLFVRQHGCNVAVARLFASEIAATRLSSRQAQGDVQVWGCAVLRRKI